MSTVSPEEQSKLEGTSFSAKTIFSLEEAMSLYGLTDSQSFWEVQQDTRCLIAWGNNTVVVSFRGTASMKNALADVQVNFDVCSGWAAACPAAFDHHNLFTLSSLSSLFLYFLHFLFTQFSHCQMIDTAENSGTAK